MSDLPTHRKRQTMSDLPTRNKAHAYLNHLKDIRGDQCIESCAHSVATNIAEHCLEAYVDGRLSVPVECDYEALAQQIYKFSSPYGVITWEQLPHPRQEAFATEVQRLVGAALKGDSE